ncbi:MAG: substrate-binding domain-containing protein, partial [Lachnospiraceae bacterium]|nr:substrate-binding domain-containing protein [Lachnospiraceae bacterium]
MKRKVLSVLLAASMVLAMTACGAKEEAPAEAPAAEAAAPAAEAEAPAADAAAPAAEGTKKVGVILKTLSSEYWGYVAAGVNAAGADLGVDVDLQGPANEQAYDEQNNQIETMLTAGVDAFVIAPLQSDSVASVIGSQNIPILTVDTDADIPG